MIKMQSKMPSEIWYRSLDISPWIQGTNAAVAVSATVVSGSVIVDEVFLSGPTTVIFRLSGGEAVSSNLFKIFVSTSDGQLFGQNFSVFVEP